MSTAEVRTTRNVEQDLYWYEDIFICSACSPTYSEIFLTGCLTHSLPSMTFWRHLVIYFNVFMLRNVSKLVKLRFFQVCPEYGLANISRYFSHRTDRYIHPVHSTLEQRWAPTDDWGFPFGFICTVLNEH